MRRPPSWAAVLAGATVLAATACRRGEEDPTVRQSLREATITAEVRSRLLAVEALRELPLTVVTRGGRVSVGGEVRDSTQIETVREIAGRVRGVERVTLEVRIVPPPPDSAPAGPEPRRGAPPTGPAEPLPSLEEAG